VEEHCRACNAQIDRVGSIIKPHYKEGSKLLFLLDFPSAEDAEDGRVMTGLSKRAIMIHRMLDSMGLNPDAISFATVLRCVTKSKAVIRMMDYEECGKQLLEELPNTDIKTVVAFGSVPARVLLGKRVDNIDEARAGNMHQTLVPDVTMAVTYALSILTEKGCSGCGKNVYPFLSRKDIESAVADLKKRGLV